MDSNFIRQYGPAVLAGLQQERDVLDEKIADVERQIQLALSYSSEELIVDEHLDDAKASEPAPRKRLLSPAARKRISDAQKKRWASARKRK